jgi:hypothetical protein
MDAAEETPQEREYREKREGVQKAIALLEKSTGFPKSQIRIHEQERAFKRNRTVASERLSEPRLKESLKLLDIHCKNYLPLVVDIDSEKAYANIVKDYVLPQVWDYFGGWEGGFLIDMVPPTPSFAAPGVIPLQLQRDRLQNRAQHWVVEGYKRLDLIARNKDATAGQHIVERRGYRTEVYAWMKRKNIETIAIASKRLAVSQSTLKSIMSSRGKARYGSKTLRRVLDEIS